MLDRIHTLADQRATFAFETTLASRTFAPWLAGPNACHVGLLFLSIPDPATCITRVRQRVAEGGHDVPAATIRRRHARGVHNLFNLYMPLTDDWAIYDNAGDLPRPIAVGTHETVEQVHDDHAWQELSKASNA